MEEDERTEELVREALLTPVRVEDDALLVELAALREELTPVLRLVLLREELTAELLRLVLLLRLALLRDTLLRDAPP